MKKFKKIINVLIRYIIKLIIYVNVDIYISLYTKFLKYIGIVFCGETSTVKFIDPTAYFDGTDYSLIRLGDNVTISREVLLLTHDYSLTSAICAAGFAPIKRNEGELFIKRSIIIGDNCFIGARASLLPGTTIERNCIIGSCAVVKGFIPENSIVIGNPAKVIGHTDDYALKMLKQKKYNIE